MQDEDKSKEELILELRQLRLQTQKVEEKQLEFFTDFFLEEHLFREEKQQLLKTIINLFPGWVFIKNKKGEFILCNDEQIYHLANSPEEVYGKISSDFLPKSLADSILADDWKVLQKGETIINKEEQTSGTKGLAWISTSKAPLRDSKGSIIGLLGFSQDISDRKNIEDSLRESEEQLKHILSNVPALISFISNEEIYRYINPKNSEYLGLFPDDIVGRSIKEVIGENNYEQIKPHVQEVLSGKKVNFESFLTYRKKQYSFRVNYVPYLNQGKQDGFFSLALDVTEQKNLESKLRHSQKMEAIGVLTGGIAHEFNNLLSPILGYTEILLRDKAEDDPERNHLDQIQNAGNRAKNLVQQMLAYGRKSFSIRKSVALEALVEDAIKLLKNTISPNISIKKEIEVNLPSVFGMPDELHQVLLNLCLNASHSMPAGGEITIRLKNKPFHKFINSEGQQQEEDFICLIIQDTGIGMDQSTLEKIYDPFFTTKDVGEGSGLGLSVVHGIVEQHGGQIEVESKIGEGTTFHVYFPISEQEEAQTSEVNTELLSKGNNNILLIDDELMITNLTKNMLENLGYTVTVFLDCEEALTLFSDHPQDFDLVITDYGMPQMNGKQFGEKLKEIRPDIPIILFTGYGDLVLKEDIQTWGMEDLLMKPFKLKELSDVVKEVLNRQIS